MQINDAELTMPGRDLEPSNLVSYDPRTSNSEFAELKQIIKGKGLLDKQPVYYTIRVALLGGLLVAGVAYLILVHNFWLQILDAPYLAFVFAQIGLLGHEAGHRQMYKSLWKHDAIGLLGGTFVIGMSYSWWVYKHNNHHSHPNQVDMDPDIDIPILEFSSKRDVLQLGSFRRFLVKHQSIIFLPALMSVAFSFQVHGIRHLLTKKSRLKALEWILIIGHHIAYLALVFSCLHFWQAIIFILIHQALTGLYLGSVFAPNHKGMPILDKESDMGFLHRQIITARNIYAHPLTDFWYGGLNYQIEHHLFPSMPRNKLKEAQQIIKAFCQAHNIPYYETDFVQSYKEILNYLHEIGDPLRQAA